VLGVIALAAFLAWVGLHFSQGNRASGEVATSPGNSARLSFSDFTGFLRRLTKSKKDEWLGGVCGGLGEHTHLPSWVWRLLFLLLLFCYGTGVVLYVLLWICLPEQPKEDRSPVTPPGNA